MKTIHKLIYALFILSILNTFASAQAIAPKALEVGDQCPDFVFNLFNSKTKSAKLSDYKGKVVILDFWATYCSPCVASLPQLNEVQNKMGDKVQIILINEETQQIAEHFFNERKQQLKQDLT